MPRTLPEILSGADALARRFEEHDPQDDGRDAAPLREVRRAFENKARAEAALVDAVSLARAHDHSWVAVGAMLGTSGEAARQRYGRLIDERPPT